MADQAPTEETSAVEDRAVNKTDHDNLVVHQNSQMFNGDANNRAGKINDSAGNINDSAGNVNEIIINHKCTFNLYVVIFVLVLHKSNYTMLCIIKINQFLY